ncbi:VCBS repeat-containing protein [Dactylosporangium fulvum]|uniref:VCBS repeat-containing protein n=1 Tax=Dactylosporangium fulvum TaxID=53359 RepID=A0ABY5VRW7_9ACTN|nr:VCBS repeat-containing protein [Dactylosporangium fulvum]UWP80512.1 VCBS repeat-containing protein [Dactylosporangium fulvum]
MTTSTRVATLGTALTLAVLTVLAGTPAAQASPGDSKRDHTKIGKSTKTPSKMKSKKWDTSAIRSKRAATSSARGSAAAAPMSATADVTGDGRADLVAQLPSVDGGALRVYANNGATTSNPWQSTYVATSPQWGYADILLLADVTGDGRADVIARDPATNSGTLWIYPNNGSASANPWPEQNRYAAGTGWNSVDRILVGDITGDKRPDLLARNGSVDGGTLYVYPNNGSVTSNPWTQAPIWSGTGWNLAQAIMLGDATGDGRLDIVARDSNGAILVYPHNGSTSSNFWTSIIYGSTGGWSNSGQLTLADVTGDGRPDLIARDTTGALWVHPWLNSTSGTMWSATTRFSAGSGFAYAAEVLTGDINGDGKLELVTKVARGGDLWLLPNNKAATGNPWPSRISAGTDWGFASQVFLGDVNGDSLLDLIAYDRSASNGTLWVYPNNGSTTGPRWTSRYFAGTGWNIFNYLMVGDVTGDGIADIVGRFPNGDLYAYPGNGSTTAFPWDPRVWVGSNWQTATRLALGDVDHDGIADLIDLENDGSLWVFPTGASTDPIVVPGNWSGTRWLNIGYVTGNPGPDLVVGDASGRLSIYTNNGATTGNQWSGTARSGGDGYQDAISLVL